MNKPISYYQPTFTDCLLMLFITLLMLFGIFLKAVNVTENIHQSAATALAGGLSAANASNYTARQLDHTLGMPVANCLDIKKIVQDSLPPGYNVNARNVGQNRSIACELKGPTGVKRRFTATGIG